MVVLMEPYSWLLFRIRGVYTDCGSFCVTYMMCCWYLWGCGWVSCPPPLQWKISGCTSRGERSYSSCLILCATVRWPSPTPCRWWIIKKKTFIPYSYHIITERRRACFKWRTPWLQSSQITWKKSSQTGEVAVCLVLCNVWVSVLCNFGSYTGLFIRN